MENILLTDNLRKLIIDEELKLKRLKTVETNGHRTSIKNKIRDNKILEAQKHFAAGRLVNIHIYSIYITFILHQIYTLKYILLLNFNLTLILFLMVTIL
jgi:hypothetical protein